MSDEAKECESFLWQDDTMGYRFPVCRAYDIVPYTHHCRADAGMCGEDAADWRPKRKVTATPT